MKRVICLSVVIAILVSVYSLNADDWPQWRGPDRDGVWKESGIVRELPAEPRIKWRVEIGAGYSGPTVVGNRVFVMDRVTDPEQIERVLCFDARSGEEVWQHSYPAQYRVNFPAGPRASVTVHEGRAFALGTMGQFTCLNAEDGKVVWEKDLTRVYAIETKDRKTNRMPIWGMTCSPLIYKDKVILQVGAKNAGVVAFDAETGEESWRATDDRGQYSSPVLTKQGSKDVLVCWTGDSVCGIAPEDGNVFWAIEWKPRNMPIGCASPVINGNHVFCTSFYDGSMMIELNPEKPEAEMLWHEIGDSERETKALHSIISTPIWLGDHIYGVDSYGEFRCLKAETGERIWEDLTAVPKARWSTIHFVKNGDKTWMFNERGELLIGKLSPEGFEELSRMKIIEPTKPQLNQRGGVCWSHPAFAQKSIFARNDKELICVDLAN